MTSHHTVPRNRGRFTYLVAIVSAGLALVLLFWPTGGRRIARRLATLSDVLSCKGRPNTAGRIGAIRNAIRDEFSATTAITIQGLVNSDFSQEQLTQETIETCAQTPQLRVHLNQVSVDISNDQLSAQAHADVSIQYESEGRLDTEYRRATVSLRRELGSYRIVALEVSANIVNQPEPRP